MEERNKTIKVTCFKCKKEYTINVTEDDYLNWKEGGMLVQDAFPYLSANERELLMSRICGTCFDKMFS